MNAYIINTIINMFMYCVIPLALMYIWANVIYRKTDYGKQHKEGVWKILLDNGALGEYKTSRQFEKADFYHKIIYNCYLPKNENETTEIDIIAISEKGIWVIENKNYQGWIFGEANHKKWCQTIYKKKSFFYNPIWQNRTHMECLKKVLKTTCDDYFKSIIVFNRATLKKVPSQERNVYVFDGKQFEQFIKTSSPTIFFKTEVDKIYYSLLPYTKVTKEEKKKHVDNIKRKYK